MTAQMDPGAVLEYKERLAERLSGLLTQESILGTDAVAQTDVSNTERGLIPQVEWFGPDALWSENLASGLETVFRYRANEAATGARLVEDLQETLQIFVDRWNEDEDAIAGEMSSLISELENWKN